MKEVHFKFNQEDNLWDVRMTLSKMSGSLGVGFVDVHPFEAKEGIRHWDFIPTGGAEEHYQLKPQQWFFTWEDNERPLYEIKLQLEEKLNK